MRLRRGAGGLLAPGLLVAVMVTVFADSATAAGAAAAAQVAGSGGTTTSAPPTTTAAWPTPGYSAEELRPVVDALLQLATGASPAPTVAPPDPAPSSTPRTTGPGTAMAEPVPIRPARPSPPGARPGWAVPIVVLAMLGVVGVVVPRWLSRRQSRARLPRPPIEPGTAGPEVSTPEPAATTGIAERVDLALRHAWSALRQSGRSAPSVIAVRVGDLGVEILLDTPDPDAPGRFVASDGGHVWALGPEVADDDLRRSVGQEPAPLPALLTVGTTPEGPVLVDLVNAGTLSVEGDATLVGAFLAGSALELATAPWAAATALGLVGGDDRLGALGNVAVLGSTASQDAGASVHGLSPALQRRVSDWLEGAPGVATVVIAPGIADPGQTEEIATAVVSRPERAGLVASGPIPEAQWRLVIDPGGGGVLHPLGLELACAVDTEAVAVAVAGLSSSATTVPARPTKLEGPDSQTPPEGPGVLVLGTVVVRWPPVAGRRRPTRRKLEEVVVYLATHPERPVPAERLRTAIWPLSEDERAGEVADSSFRATMSRTRVALGAGPNGRPYLPEACDGCYELDAAFGCDWVDFKALVRRSRSVPAPEAMALLGEALGLVRGAPFADSPRGAFGWAWSEQLVSAIEVAVADVAERLAELALAAGDHATARRAAEKGLLVVASRESLYRARMRAAFEAGDIDDVEQAYTEVRRAARTIGEEPQGETTALYERLRRATRPEPEDAGAAGGGHLAVVP